MRGNKMLGRKIVIVDDDESGFKPLFFVLGKGQ